MPALINGSHMSLNKTDYRGKVDIPNQLVEQLTHSASVRVVTNRKKRVNPRTEPSNRVKPKNESEIEIDLKCKEWNNKVIQEGL